MTSYAFVHEHLERLCDWFGMQFRNRLMIRVTLKYLTLSTDSFRLFKTNRFKCVLRVLCESQKILLRVYLFYLRFFNYTAMQDRTLLILGSITIILCHIVLTIYYHTSILAFLLLTFGANFIDLSDSFCDTQDYLLLITHSWALVFLLLLLLLQKILNSFGFDTDRLLILLLIEPIHIHFVRFAILGSLIVLALLIF